MGKRSRSTRGVFLVDQVLVTGSRGQVDLEAVGVWERGQRQRLRLRFPLEDLGQVVALLTAAMPEESVGGAGVPPPTDAAPEPVLGGSGAGREGGAVGTPRPAALSSQQGVLVALLQQKLERLTDGQARAFVRRVLRLAGVDRVEDLDASQLATALTELGRHQRAAVRSHR